MHVKPEGGYTRVVTTQTDPPPQPGHADTLKPNAGEAADQVHQRLKQSVERNEEVHSADLKDYPDGAPRQQEMQEKAGVDATSGSTTPVDSSRPSPKPKYERDSDLDTDVALDFWEPKPPKVLMQDPNATPLELHAQIQLYATTEYVSCIPIGCS